MTNLDILIPFGLPPAEMAKDLLRELKMPSLALLIARSRSTLNSELDAYSRALPHEVWLAKRLGLADSMNADSLPFANAMMHSLGFSPEAGHWFILQPAHFHVARDHIVLTDPRKLVISDQESRRLFDSIQPLFEESGKSLVYGNAHTWFMRADEWADLQTSTPEAASGHNIDIWMPQGTSARAWRKLLNEVQMQWHMHSLNAEREDQGLQPVNSLWLWGGGQARQQALHPPYQKILNSPVWAQAQGTFLAGIDQNASPSEMLDDPATQGLAILPELIDPALAEDWSAWLENMHLLEKNWFSALLESLKNGKIEQLTLVFTHGSRLLESASGKHSIKKFWVKPSLTSLSR